VRCWQTGIPMSVNFMLSIKAGRILRRKKMVAAAMVPEAGEVYRHWRWKLGLTAVAVTTTEVQECCGSDVQYSPPTCLWVLSAVETN
jgi:hypothetical protein